MKHHTFLTCAALCAMTFTVPAFAAKAESAAAVAKPPATQTMTYDVYAGGIHAVKAEMNVTYPDSGHYNMKISSQTIGFLEKLVPWRGSFETKGWLTKDGNRPELHHSEAIWRGDADVTEYSYNKDGSFKHLKIVEASVDKTPEKTDPEIVKGTVDVLTGMLDVMQHIQTDGKCEGSAMIFDGKRNFEMVFNHDMEEVLLPTDYNVYEGPSSRCQVEVKPGKGEWHVKPRGWMSIQEQGRQRDSMPTVWFAKVSDDMPAVPVKVRVKTEYGTLFMHLTQYTNGNRVIKASAKD